MCGLVGFLRTSKSLTYNRDLAKFFSDALYADALRGMHSTGMFTIEKGDAPFFAKDTVNAYHFLSQERVKRYVNAVDTNVRAAIGHNRFATVGGHGYDSAHPHITDNVVLVHNGTLREYHHLPEHKKASSDSARLAQALSNEEPGGLNVFRNVRGAYACIWWDDRVKTLYVARNDERPLAYTKTKDNLFIASEGPMLRWLLSRDKRDFWEKGHKTLDFAVHTIYGWKVDGGKVEQLENVKYTPPKPVTYYSSKGGGKKGGGKVAATTTQGTTPAAEEYANKVNLYLKGRGVDLIVGEIVECAWVTWEPYSHVKYQQNGVQYGTMHGYLNPDDEENCVNRKEFEGTIWCQVGACTNSLLRKDAVIETIHAEVRGVIDMKQFEDEPQVDCEKDLVLRMTHQRQGEWNEPGDWKREDLKEFFDDRRWYYSLLDKAEILYSDSETKLTRRETDMIIQDGKCDNCDKPGDEVPATNVIFYNPEAPDNFICSKCCDKLTKGEKQ